MQLNGQSISLVIRRLQDAHICNLHSSSQSMYPSDQSIKLVIRRLHIVQKCITFAYHLSPCITDCGYRLYTNVQPSLIISGHACTCTYSRSLIRTSHQSSWASCSKGDQLNPGLVEILWTKLYRCRQKCLKLSVRISKNCEMFYLRKF